MNDILIIYFVGENHGDSTVSILQVFRKQRNRIMCTYKDIELVELPNGKTAKHAHTM